MAAARASLVVPMRASGCDLLQVQEATVSLIRDVEVLRNVPMFANIEPAKLKLVAFTSERLTFDPGDTVFSEGEVGDAVYIIVEGSAEVQVATPRGPLKVADLGRNDVVGEIAILCDVPRTATVVAASPVTALRISKELFYQLIAQVPQMAIEIMRELARRVDRTTERYRLAVSGDDQ
ncbi:cyclic nucleotide-binding domain-containing protein [Tistrella bauzanensis]|jgi:CRP/FNR family transcriptional regulator, cyclic AMP receptor protein